MAKDTPVSLGEHFDDFVEEQVASGRYTSASDVVREALRLMEEREAKVRALNAALHEGFDSGPPEPFDFDAFLAGKRAALDKNA